MELVLTSFPGQQSSTPLWLCSENKRGARPGAVAVSLYYNIIISSVLSPSNNTQPHNTPHNITERRDLWDVWEQGQSSHSESVQCWQDGEPALTGYTGLVAAWSGLDRDGQAEKSTRFRQPASVRPVRPSVTQRSLYKWWFTVFLPIIGFERKHIYLSSCGFHRLSQVILGR